MSRQRITAGPGSVICNEAVIEGEVSIGAGTVLHPQCRVIAENGPIYIGHNNIIEENAMILNKEAVPLVIGDDNVFEVGSYVEGSRIGNGNMLEARAKVLGKTTLGNHCVIGAGCSTLGNETLPDRTVIYGSQSSRRIQSDILPDQLSLHARHLEYLREVLPKFNHVKNFETTSG